MVEMLMLSVGVLFGIAVASVLAGLNKKPLWRIINMFSSALLTVGGFVFALCVYARLTHREISFSSVFPDRVSLLIGMYVFIILSVIVGFFVGAVSAGGIERYMPRLYKSKAFYPVGILVLTLTVAVTSICAYPLIASKSRGSVVINEICHHNFNLVCDGEENYSDYIELYNTGNTSVDLSSLYISDSPNEKDKFRLPEYILAPGGYILIWADSSDKGFSNDAIYANFSLSDNETVILSNSYNKTIDAISLPSLPHNVSVTRLGDDWVYAYGTPLQSNEGCILYKAPTLHSPVFSIESGFYTEDIILEIKAQKGADIYYTTDGSVPDESSTKYTGALTLTDISDQPNKVTSVKNTVSDYDAHDVDEAPVEKANVIRAIAINKKGEISEVVTKTYFVGKTAENYDGYSILSIISDPDDLFGDKGICVTGAEYDNWYNNTDRTEAPPRINFWRSGKQWERAATIELFDENRDIVISQNCGIRVQGNASRNYAVKRFSIFAREAYSGSRYFDAPLFGNTDTHSVYLRHDNYDMAVHDMLKDVDGLPVQRCIPVIVFLNGEKYTLSYIREKYDTDYFEEYYGVKREDLLLIADNLLEEGDPLDYTLYEEFLNFVTTCDASDPAVYEEICEKMDVQSFINFMCTNLYMNNIDWSLCKNIMMWRSLNSSGDGYNDGKWRFCILDTDAVAGSGDMLKCKNAVIDPFEVNLPYVEGGLGGYKLKYKEAPIFSNLIKNSDFKRQFILTYFDLMNTEFSTDAIEDVLVSFGVADDTIWNQFYKDRPQYATANIIRAMGLSGDLCSVSITCTDGGAVSINSSGDKEYIFGNYPVEYGILISAIPKEGYRFAGWEGDILSDEEVITANLSADGLSLRAIFEKEGDS